MKNYDLAVITLVRIHLAVGKCIAAPWAVWYFSNSTLYMIIDIPVLFNDCSRLLDDTIKGGARLDEENEAQIYISDSNDVYGIINIKRGSEIMFDPETNTR